MKYLQWKETLYKTKKTCDSQYCHYRENHPAGNNTVANVPVRTHYPAVVIQFPGYTVHQNLDITFYNSK